MGMFTQNYKFGLPLSVFAGHVWQGVYGALQVSSGLVLPPRLRRVRLSSRIHGKRL